MDLGLQRLAFALARQIFLTKTRVSCELHKRAYIGFTTTRRLKPKANNTMSEIDNIFGTGKAKSTAPPTTKSTDKGKAKDISAQQPPAAAAPSSDKTTKKMKKKRKHDEAADQQATSQSDSKQKKAAPSKHPEILLDPSAVLAAEAKPQPRPKKTKSKSKDASSASSRAAPNDADDLDDFTNSKGSSRESASYEHRCTSFVADRLSFAFRPIGSRTEEGFAIYSESELKLGKGGDTPLCPFDCTCCEYVWVLAQSVKCEADSTAFTARAGF